MDSIIRKKGSLASQFGRLRKTLSAGNVIRQQVVLLSVIALAACNGSSGSGAPSTFTQAQAPGHFVTFSQHCYESADLPNLQNDDADAVNSAFQQHGWTLSRYSHDDPSCSNAGYQGFPASQLTDSTTNNADFAWYSGHGVQSGPDFGIIVFWPYSTGTYCNNNPTYCFNRKSTGLPFQGPNLKWFFANVSYGVELPPYDWLSAFSQSGSGLHGFYGFQGEPTDLYGQQLGQEFATAAIQTTSNANPVPVRTAWIDAARANGRADQYGVFELKSANQDQISGNSSNPPYTSNGTFSTGNPVVYYDSSGQQSFTPNQNQSLSTQSPGSYQPRSLTTEGWSDSYLAGQAAANSSGYIETQPTTNVHRFLGTNYTADHYEATSAVIIRTAMSTAPFADTQASSQQFAANQVAAHGGMPADAVLARTVVHYSADTAPTSGPPVIIGYDFIWQHSDGTGGGDMIDVGVDNIMQRTCAQVNENDPPYNKPPCLQWTTSPVNRTNYLYRLWRTHASVRYPLGVNPGTPMLSPAQAVQFVQDRLKGNSEALGSLNGYSQTFWSTPYDSTDNTAYPAYNFYYSSHNVLTLDALSGAMLGSSTW